jgi:SAM-dependent methyltransferase
MGDRACCVGLYSLPITEMLLGPSFHPGGLAATRALARAALIGRGTAVLDVACGRGTSDLMLAEEHGAQVTGLDADELNVEAATETTRARGLEPRAVFVVGRAEQLPFEDCAFDVVVCECALCTFDDAPAAVAEMARVLRRRGRIALSDVVIRKPVPDRLRGPLAHAMCIASARSVAEVSADLRDGGFESIRIADHTDVLFSLLDDIERRLGSARRLAREGVVTMPELADADAILAAARDFVRAGGLGYVSYVGRVAK